MDASSDAGGDHVLISIDPVWGRDDEPGTGIVEHFKVIGIRLVHAEPLRGGDQPQFWLVKQGGVQAVAVIPTARPADHRDSTGRFQYCEEVSFIADIADPKVRGWGIMPGPSVKLIDGKSQRSQPGPSPFGRWNWRLVLKIVPA